MDLNLTEKHFLEIQKGDSFSSLGSFYYIEDKYFGPKL